MTADTIKSFLPSKSVSKNLAKPVFKLPDYYLTNPGGGIVEENLR